MLHNPQVFNFLFSFMLTSATYQYQCDYVSYSEMITLPTVDGVLIKTTLDH